MAPLVSFGPKHCCNNFPLCTSSQLKQRKSDGSRSRLPHCSSCSVRGRCAFPGCENPSAPSTGRYRTDFCTTHYRDPCYANLRKWGLCSESRTGCLHLVEEPRASRCFACNNGSLPCANSLSGCRAYVRNPPKTSLQLRRPCSSQNLQQCPFDPTNSRSCSEALCGSPRTSSTEPRCLDCCNGRLPCPLICSRRTANASDSLCTLCLRQISPPVSPSSVQSAPPSVPPTDCTSACSSSGLRDHSDVSSHANPLMIAGSELAPQKGFRPAYACFNFPLCVDLQQRPRLSLQICLQTVRHRSPYCNNCAHSAANARCSHPLCTHPVAPSSKGKRSHGFCRLHVADLGHASVREWALCRSNEDAVFVFFLRLSKQNLVPRMYTLLLWPELSRILHHRS